jgi:hypothetical protein
MLCDIGLSETADTKSKRQLAQSSGAVRVRALRAFLRLS